MRTLRLTLLLVFLPIAGCSKTNSLQVSQDKIPQTNKTVAAKGHSENPLHNVTVKDSPAKISPKSATSTKTETAFKPPFQHRQNPFRRPDYSKNQSLTRQTGSTAPNDIQLKGFVNLNGIRALLAIHGKIASLKQGAKMDGVEVIEISPPRVVLQQGRFRWTESLVKSP